MISVERVMEYTDLEKEASWESSRRPPPEWPAQGMIAFENVNFTYSLDGPLVLRHFSALIRSKEKVCICCLLQLDPTCCLILSDIEYSLKSVVMLVITKKETL